MPYGFMLRQAALTTALCALAGCSIPARMEPAPLRSVSDLAAERTLAGPAAGFPADEWWKAYRDPGLDALIAEALVQAPDVAIAAARIRAADATAGETAAANGPQVSVEATAGGQKQSYNMGYPKQFVPKGIQDTGRISAMFGLDLDLWGKNRAALAAARGEAEAARVDAAQARLMVASAIALSWGRLAALEADRALAAESAAALGQVEQLTDRRRQSGIDNASDLALASGRRAAAQAEVAALDEAIALERNALAALAGAGPDRAATLPHPAPDLAVVTGVPASISLDLVGRRPDLVSARLRVEAAASRVESARRAYYPDINLAAVVGLQSIGLGKLFSGDSSYGQAAPALSVPLFEGDRLGARYEGSRAGYDEALARYDQVLIGAVHEVADALESRRALAPRLAAARDAANAAAEAARLARLRHGEGLASLIQVLAAEDASAAARRNLAQLEARAFVLDVTLVRALGGGFAAPVAGPEQIPQ